MCVRSEWKGSSLLSLLLLGLFIVACSGSPVQIASTSKTPTSVPVVAQSPTPVIGSSQTASTTIGVTLVPVPGVSTPSPAEMDADSAILSGRLAAFGLVNVQISQVIVDGQPALQVDVPHFSEDESGTLDALLVTGNLEFWSTGAMPVQPDTYFEPSQYIQYNPGSTAQFTNDDLDASKIFVDRSQNGNPEINLAMKSSAASRFFSFTQQNIGQYLTITLDRKVIESALIQSAINGPFVITGNFTTQKANALASTFKYAALPVALQKSSEQIFTPG